MKPDIELIRAILATLNRVGAPGLTDEALSTAAELELGGRLLTREQYRDGFDYAKSKGWLNTRRDGFERDIAWITEAGKTTFAGM